MLYKLSPVFSLLASVQKDFSRGGSFLPHVLISRPLSSGPLAAFHLFPSGQVIFAPHFTVIIHAIRQNLP